MWGFIYMLPYINLCFVLWILYLGSELEKKLAAIRHETRIHILNLLITSLERSPPNLALYLLGFELKKPISTTNLQDPGKAVPHVGIYFLHVCWCKWSFIEYWVHRVIYLEDR